MTTTLGHPRAARRLHSAAGPPAFDVTDTLVLTVDAEPETVREALERLGLDDAAARALRALGLAGQRPGTSRSRPSGAGGSFLSAKTRVAASDEATGKRLRGDWGVIRPIVHGLTRRRLAAVKAYAEDLVELSGAGSTRRSAA